MGCYACLKVFHCSQGKQVAHYYHSNLLPNSCGCGHDCNPTKLQKTQNLSLKNGKLPSQFKRNQPRKRWHMRIDSLRKNAQKIDLNSFDGPFP